MHCEPESWTFFSKENMKQVVCLVLVLVQLFGPGIRSESVWDKFENCKNGKKQSPVDLSVYTEVAKKPEDNLKIDDATFTLLMNFSNNGQFVLAKVQSPQKDSFGRYWVAIFFKWPAEHIVAGTKQTFEIGVIHYDQPQIDWQSLDQMTITSVLAKIGSPNEEIEKFVSQLSHIKMQSSTPYQFTDTFNIYKLLPTDHSHFKYEGGMTMPPCHEGIKHMVLKNPITMSEEQIENFKKLQFSDGTEIKDCARETQQLFGRIVEYVSYV